MSAPVPAFYISKRGIKSIIHSFFSSQSNFEAIFVYSPVTKADEEISSQLRPLQIPVLRTLYCKYCSVYFNLSKDNVSLVSSKYMHEAVLENLCKTVINSEYKLADDVYLRNSEDQKQNKRDLFPHTLMTSFTHLSIC